MILFSVVIPTYDRPEKLANCLAALSRLKYPQDSVEVLVVDDGSPRGIADIVEPFRAQLNLTDLRQKRCGPAAARNAGAANARGKFLVFIDDDCCVSPGCLTAYEEAFRETPECLLSGRVENANPDNSFVATSELIIQVLLDNFLPEPGGIYFARSANLALPSEAFATLGGFDNSFQTAEDREFSDRWILSGQSIRVVAGATVSHASTLSLNGFWRQHFRYGRGAYQFHRLRRARGSGGFRLEFLRFYVKVFAAPLNPPSRGSFRTLALLILWQLANSSGFAFEFIRRRLLRRNAAAGRQGAAVSPVLLDDG
jgi:glycosyltransferase involved in cell wall biosynthesis